MSESAPVTGSTGRSAPRTGHDRVAAAVAVHRRRPLLAAAILAGLVASVTLLPAPGSASGGSGSSATGAGAGSAAAQGNGAGRAGGEVHAAARKPRLRITTFNSDRTLRPGRTSSVTVFCRRGFRLLSTRFVPIAVKPSGAGNRPVFELTALVPTPKGSTFTFRNLGTTTVTIRTSADCARVTGRVARRSSASSGDGSRARATRKKSRPVKLKTYVRETKKKVGGAKTRASAAKNRTLRVSCDKSNSIPGDVGFKSNRSEFAGARFFKKKGDIGVKGRFRTDGKDKLKLFLSCVQGKRVKLKGKLAKGVLAAARTPEVEASAKKPKIVVRYGVEQGTQRFDSPFAGTDSFVGASSRSVWSGPVPVSIPEGIAWIGRGSQEAPQSGGASAAGVEMAAAAAVGFVMAGLGLDPENPDDIRELRELGFGELLRLAGIDVDDDREPDARTVECNDGVDNDNDAKIDFFPPVGASQDPGCFDGTWDDSEKDVTSPLGCPSGGGTIDNYTDFHFGTNPMGVPYDAYGYQAFDPATGLPLEVSNDVHHGPFDPGFDPCGGGTDTTIESGVGTEAPFAPPATGLPAVPDEETLRIKIGITGTSSASPTIGFGLGECDADDPGFGVCPD